MYSMANVMYISSPDTFKSVDLVDLVDQDATATEENYFKLVVIEPIEWDTFTVNYGNNIPPIKVENISTTYKKYKLIPFRGKPYQVVPANITFSNQNVQIATLLFAEDGVNVTLTAQPTLGYFMRIILNPNAQSNCSSGSTPSLSFDKTQIQNFGVCLYPVYTGTVYLQKTVTLNCAFINSGVWGQSGNVLGIVSEIPGNAEAFDSIYGKTTFTTFSIPIGAQVTGPGILPGTIIQGYGTQIYEVDIGTAQTGGESDFGILHYDPTNALMIGLSGTVVTADTKADADSFWTDQTGISKVLFVSELVGVYGNFVNCGNILNYRTNTPPYNTYLGPEGSGNFQYTKFNGILLVNNSMSMTEPQSITLSYIPQFIRENVVNAGNPVYGNLSLSSGDGNPDLGDGTGLVGKTIPGNFLNDDSTFDPVTTYYTSFTITGFNKLVTLKNATGTTINTYWYSGYPNN
jgi:hypothetical protein